MIKKIFKTDKTKELQRGVSAIGRYSRRFKSEMITMAFFGVIIGLFEGFIPYILGQFFDVLISPGDFNFFGLVMPSWTVWLGGFAVLQLVSNIVSWRNDLHARTLWEKIFADYQMRAFENLLKKTNKFHSESGAGKNWELMDRARYWMANILGNEIPNLAPDFLSVFVGLIVCFWISPILGVILISGICLYLYLGARLLPAIAEGNRKENKIFGKVWRDMYDAVANIFEVKRSGTEDFEVQKNRKEFNKGLGLMRNLIELWSSMSLRQNLVITSTRILVFVASVFLVSNDAITVGELIALNGYAGMLFGPFIRFLNSFAQVVEGIVKIADAENILNKPLEVYSGEKLIKPQIDGDFVFKDVQFAYSSKDGNVLKGINFEARPGSVTALVGKSGSGKSTLVDLIGGFYFPHKGSVLIDGVSTRKIDLKYLRRHIAYVSQEVTLFNDTVAKNISYGAGRKVSQEEIEEAAIKAHCHEFISQFKRGYKQVVGERGVKLSVGQKQRIAIARAILRNPTILILDEPTSALDSESEQFITQSLEELMQGRTTFVIAHRLSTVRNANTIIVMKQGRIIEQGDHQKLMNIQDGHYQYLYNMHVGLQ